MAGYQLTRRKTLQATGVGAAGLLAGCLGDDDGEEADPEVHILTDYTSDAWQDYWEEDLVPSFEDEYDIPVEVEYRGFQGTGEQRLATLMQAGEPPELYHATAPEIGDLINQGRTTQVDDVVDDLERTWSDAMFRSTITPIDDETHLVPHGVYLGGTFNYRADIYEELGLEVPETWDELLENCRAIDEADDIEAAAWALPAVAAGKSSSDFSNWLYNSGGDVWQWANNGNDIELWFDEEHVMPVLEMLEELAQYSPDPSSMDWGSTIEYWVGGRIAQCFMNNAWLAGPTFFAGQEEVALATEQALIPIREGADPAQRGWVLIDGTPIIDGSSNPEGAGDFLRYMYSEERHTTATLLEPMRFLPPYEAVMESDDYQNAEVFQVADGALLEKNIHCLENIAPELENPDSVTTPETLHINTFDIQSQMTNQLVVEGRDTETVYEWGVNEYEERLEQVRNESNY